MTEIKASPHWEFRCIGWHAIAQLAISLSRKAVPLPATHDMLKTYVGSALFDFLYGLGGSQRALCGWALMLVEGFIGQQFRGSGLYPRSCLRKQFRVVIKHFAMGSSMCPSSAVSTFRFCR